MMEDKKPKDRLIYKGYRPRLHQKTVHDYILDKKDVIVTVKSRRQSGKTVMAENIALWYAINKSRSVSCFVSITLAQSRKVFQDIVNAITKTNIIKKKNEQTLELTLKNNSKIIFKSSEQGTDSLRGYTVSGILILDEASFLSEEILQAVLPFTNVHRAPILVISTPKFKNCFFYRFFQKGLAGDKNYYSVDWNDFDLSEFLPPERLKELEQILPKNQFKTEYMGEFLDDDGVVFENFKRCIEKDVTERTPHGRLFIGIDWSTGVGNDSTSVCIINDDGEQIALYEWNNLNTTNTIERIAKIISELKSVELVLCESNSIGTPMTELLMNALPKTKIETYTTTNKSKESLVTDLQVAFEKEQIKLLDIPNQTNQLASYEAVYNPKTKNVSYNAPMGLHDDNVISLMLANKARKDSNKVGKYNIR